MGVNFARLDNHLLRILGLIVLLGRLEPTTLWQSIMEATYTVGLVIFSMHSQDGMHQQAAWSSSLVK